MNSFQLGMAHGQTRPVEFLDLFRCSSIFDSKLKRFNKIPYRSRFFLSSLKVLLKRVFFLGGKRFASVNHTSLIRHL